MAKLVRDDSLLLKSAESLGRMIGTLQRELEAAAREIGLDGAASSDGNSGRTTKRTQPVAKHARKPVPKKPSAGAKSARKAAARTPVADKTASRKAKRPR